MGTGMFSKLALATVAAVGLYAPTMGMPLPLNSCLRTVGVANAAPSPTCASDLRECLRVSARTGLYGVRYVTAEDVARCMEAFNACTHGTLRGNPNPPAATSSSSGNGNKAAMPQRFKITQDAFTIDCTVDGGSAVSCTQAWDAPGWVDSYTGSFTGTLSGWTATGTATSHIEGHSPADSSCTHVEDYSGPATYVFSPDGAVTARVGPNQRNTTSFCNGRQGSSSGLTEAGEATGTWTAIK